MGKELKGVRDRPLKGFSRRDFASALPRSPKISWNAFRSIAVVLLSLSSKSAFRSLGRGLQRLRMNSERALLIPGMIRSHTLNMYSMYSNLHPLELLDLERYVFETSWTEPLKPTKTWYRSVLSLPGVPALLRAEEDWRTALALDTPLPLLQSVVASMVAPYQQLGVIQAVNGAVALRWERLPQKQRPLILLSLRQLARMQAFGTDLVVAALSSGSPPAFGKEAGIKYRQAVDAFGEGAAQLLVEIQQMSAIELTIRAFCSLENGTAQIPEGQAEFATSLFTGQKMQDSSSARSLILFLVQKAAELRLLSGLRCHGRLPDSLLISVALAIQVFAPLANLLGLGRVKDELEDSAFAILHPNDREELRGLLGHERSEELASGAAQELEQMLLQSRITQPQRFVGLKSLRVCSRAKSAYSTWKKMQTKHMEFHKVWDKAGIRVILDAGTEEQAERICYTIRDVVLQRFSQWDSSRLKDYIKDPKPNGYQCLQFVIGWESHPLEVQIRTEKMHRNAEYGSSSHWEYKDARDEAAAASKVAMKAAARIFETIDADGDKRINDVELLDFLNRLGIQASLEQARDMLEVFDTNENGVMDFPEFWDALFTTWFPLVSGTHSPRKKQSTTA